MVAADRWRDVRAAIIRPGPEPRKDEMEFDKITEWGGRVRRMIVRCGGCAQGWLVFGLRRGDTHVCKDCGHRFVIDRRNGRDFQGAFGDVSSLSR